MDEWKDAIHLAARSGKVQEVARMLGKSPNLLRNDKGTVLHTATEAGQEEVVTFLLVKSPSLLKRADDTGNTALHCAAQRGHHKIAAHMLAVADPQLINAVNVDGLSALHVAVDRGFHKVVALMLPRTSAATLHSIVHSANVLHTSAEKGYDKIVALLLAARPELASSVTPSTELTALHLAAREGHETVVARLLVACPTLIDTRDSAHWTALHHAAHRGHETVVDRLRGTDDITTGILQLAKNAKIVAQLLEANPELIDAVDWCDGENTALHSAVLSGNLSVVGKLLELKPELTSAVNLAGNTPLHLAIEQSRISGDHAIIKRLLKPNRSALRVANRYKLTPFLTAVHSGNKPLIEFLQHKMSFDEIVAAEWSQERVAPVMEVQCEDLWTLLGQDVAGIVFEYLLGRNPRRPQQQQQHKRAKLN